MRLVAAAAAVAAVVVVVVVVEVTDNLTYSDFVCLLLFNSL